MRPESGLGLESMSLGTGEGIGHTSLQIGIFLLGIVGYWVGQVKWVRLGGTHHLTGRTRMWYDPSTLAVRGAGSVLLSLIPPSLAKGIN